MSGVHVDCTVLPKEWDNLESLRERVRGGLGLVSIESGSNGVKIPRCVNNSDLLVPILAQVGAGCRLAEVDGLREAVAEVYQANSREVTEDAIDDDAWAIRDMVFFVKRKTQREEVSLANWLSRRAELDLRAVLVQSQPLEEVGQSESIFAGEAVDTQPVDILRCPAPTSPVPGVGSAVYADTMNSSASPTTKRAKYQGKQIAISDDSVGDFDYKPLVGPPQNAVDDEPSVKTDGLEAAHPEPSACPAAEPSPDDAPSKVLRMHLISQCLNFLVTVFSRRDQLAMRSKRKEDNKEKKGKGKGKGKPTKKDKVKNTGTNNKAATRKKTDRKADEADTSATGKRKRKPKTTEEKPDKPSKTRRSKKTPVPETEVNLSEKVIQQDELAEWVWENNIDYSVDLTSFKKLVRSALTKFTYFRHNIYWTTFKCGLTMFNDEGKKDVATFSFSHDLRGLATAIACSEYAWHAEASPAKTLEEFQEELDDLIEVYSHAGRAALIQDKV
eukprot:s328_g4.t1